MAGDDWEEKMLDQLERLLSNMGMNMSREQLRSLLQQFRSQFEKMGIDEERIAKGDVNFNFDRGGIDTNVNTHVLEQLIEIHTWLEEIL